MQWEAQTPGEALEDDMHGEEGQGAMDAPAQD